MINATFSLTIQSLKETHDQQGVKIAYGDCSFQSYSKDGLVDNTVPFRAKGSAAVALTKSGTQIKGVAIGYPNLEVIDSGNGYKEKRCTLVIRNFMPTITYEAGNHQKQQQEEPTKELVVAVATTADREETVDIDSIPF